MLFAAVNASGAISAILPFVVLLVFWLVLMRRVRGQVPPGQEQLIQKLDEIREEIRRLRKTLEQNAPPR